MIFGALLWKSFGARPSALRLPQVALALAVCAAVCGWHYARVWAHFGTPLLGNWDPRTGSLARWWQDNGYQTSAYYLRFGAALAHPWFSGLQSFGDGIYSTLWGDGLFGGCFRLYNRPAWNYDLMAMGYWLALLPSLGVLVGAILALWRLIRQPSAEWSMLLGLGFLVGLALVCISLVVPSYASAKAFYGLSALVPLCACGAWGLDALSRSSGKLRPVWSIVFAVWAMNSYAAFWIVPSSVPGLIARSKALFEEKRYSESAQMLTNALRLQPDNPAAHYQLALALDTLGQTAEAIPHYYETLRLEPASPEALNNLAWIRAAHPQPQFRNGAEAVRLAERACSVTGYQELMMLGTLAAACAEAGRFDEAVAVAAKARDLALATGEKDGAEQSREFIRLFTARQPYREPAGELGPNRP